MKCPDCGSKISQKHYDPAYEWYECPKCEGCFTSDEILEAEMSKHPARAPKSDPRRTTVMAKGKKRQAAQEAEGELEDNLTKAVSDDVRKAPDASTKHRDALSARQVVPIMADEIQEIYSALGGQIDFMNAQDKALTIYRDLAYHGHVAIREQPVKIALCKEHS